MFLRAASAASGQGVAAAVTVNAASQTSSTAHHRIGGKRQAAGCFAHEARSMPLIRGRLLPSII
jgi:hypothetical protein